jgi:hypothetical protein
LVRPPSLEALGAHLFGPLLGAFEADLHRLLHDTSPTGVFSQHMREIALDLWRP